MNKTETDKSLYTNKVLAVTMLKKVKQLGLEAAYILLQFYREDDCSNFTYQDFVNWYNSELPKEEQ